MFVNIAMHICLSTLQCIYVVSRMHWQISSYD